MLIPVILSGGSGSRLWPLSRELFPKQLLSLVGSGGTMLQDTVLRACGLASVQPAIVVCNEEHRFLIAEQLAALGLRESRLILEPVGRSTAPAVAVAAEVVLSEVARDVEPLLLVMPADHVISDVGVFHAAVRRAIPLAAQGQLVTFGVVPTSPEIGFGYIRHGHLVDGAAPILEFIEKPNSQRATMFVNTGGFLWNSGIFLFSARHFLRELGAHASGIAASVKQACSAREVDGDFIRVDRAAFEACPSDSIDYAVMEKSRVRMVVPLDAGWSDVGSWSSLQDAMSRDVDGNVLRGDVVAVDTENSLLISESRLVGAIGLKDLVVVETKDAVLVVPRERSQDVKALVTQLRESGRSEHSIHREVFRPWGSYDSMDEGHGYKVKRLSVKPGCALSLQRHKHRAEHWVVVAGRARITRNDEVFELLTNQSTYIPVGAVHRIENTGNTMLQIIEVQTGSYLGEDDIERLEDRYGRERL